MISKLLQNDRPYWVASSILYALMGLASIVAAGPLMWAIRADSGESAGSAGVSVGSLAGVLLLAAVLAVMSSRRAPTLRIPRITVAAGVLATVLATVNTALGWFGLLALIPVALSVVGVFATRRVLQYQAELAKDAKKSRKKRKHAAVDVNKTISSSSPDVALTLGVGVVTVAFGVIGSLVVGTMTSWFSPDLPDELTVDGQIVVGEGNPVEVEVLYGVNYPHALQLFGDSEETLSTLVDEDVAELTLQGVSLGSETRMAVPVVIGEACAWETDGPEGAFQFMTEYSQQVAGDPLGTDVNEAILAAGEQFGDDFRRCHQSGKYELVVGHELEKSPDHAEQNLPQVTVDGEEVQPETLADLEETIRAAAQ